MKINKPTPFRYKPNPGRSPMKSFDSELDKFSEPQPYPSWTLNNDFVWEAPTPRPEDHNAETGPYYVWDEDNASWSAEYPPTGGEGADG